MNQVASAEGTSAAFSGLSLQGSVSTGWRQSTFRHNLERLRWVVDSDGSVRMKATKIRVWPELVDYLPALAVLTDPRRNSALPTEVELDFAAVRDVSSSGLAVFLLQLSRLLGPQRGVIVRHEASPAVRTRLDELGCSSFLLSLPGGKGRQSELFQEPKLVEPPCLLRHGLHSLPVYHLRFSDACARRDTVREFLSFLKREVSRLAEATSLETNGMIMLLNEIAKNTADHTNADALFGMDLFTRLDGSHRVCFVFGDLGVGIKSHIEQNLLEQESKRLRHMSLYEAYRLALKPGYTSNHTTDVNKGHGMSIIIDCATTLGLHLSVFDAWSRGILSAQPALHSDSHAAIRRIFRTIGHDVGFFYFGELIIARRQP
jgi:hypothetical protein